MSPTVTRDEAVEAVLAQASTVGGRVVILLDGGSGSGKTLLADELSAAWRTSRGEDLQVVHLDDVYPGWNGLAAAAEAVSATILRPRDPGHESWRWDTSEPGGWVRLDPSRSTLVEGCGALTRASAQLSGVRVWLELDAPRRMGRALARDEGYEPWWDTWATQEAAHWRRNRPWDLATLVVRGDRGADE